MDDELSARQRAISLRLAGRPVKHICLAVGRSEAWFHKWWDRYLQAGPEGLYDLTRARHVAQRIVDFGGGSPAPSPGMRVLLPHRCLKLPPRATAGGRPAEATMNDEFTARQRAITLRLAGRVQQATVGGRPRDGQSAGLVGGLHGLALGLDHLPQQFVAHADLGGAGEVVAGLGEAAGALVEAAGQLAGTQADGGFGDVQPCVGGDDAAGGQVVPTRTLQLDAVVGSQDGVRFAALVVKAAAVRSLGRGEKPLPRRRSSTGGQSGRPGGGSRRRDRGPCPHWR
jgi:hypothetical protein